MSNALSLEAEIACLNVQEMEQLAQSVCDQVHRLEALVGLTISVPNQALHADAAGQLPLSFWHADMVV